MANMLKMLDQSSPEQFNKFVAKRKELEESKKPDVGFGIGSGNMGIPLPQITSNTGIPPEMAAIFG